MRPSYKGNAARGWSRLEAAENWIDAATKKLERIAATARALPSRPRGFCMEWLDPLYCSGHWVPEMVRIAGGVDEISREGSELHIVAPIPDITIPGPPIETRGF